jgi:4-carboxymuconolactone decarboxylase
MAEPSRIKEIAENELTAEQKKVLEDLTAGRGKILTPYKIWIHAPQFAAAFEKVGTFLNKQGSLTTREVELCICIISNH